ncbi:HEAT repeat domain-containing protein [Luteolibacter luteus]|uniref:HEAT repeat domain-containing protein n=1 Tax=Luteolibacter luteus TaxID=2728835 RepID=A0A858RI20_9BACT|nr:HEAT repeat domain-containing protein [Luteolibacter luteus]QJE96194.1 HEAT repeat domain-containing protein [Luteolibacter luteus]
MKTGLSLEETITLFLDESTDLHQRRFHVYRLAREGTPESIAALRKIFDSAPAGHKIYMAGLIGRSGNPHAKDWLKPLLSDPNEAIVRAAIRGLGVLGGDDVSRKLDLILKDGTRPQAVRVQAAITLGSMGSAAATDALLEAFSENPSDELMAEILHGLGKTRYHEVAPVFETLIASREAPLELRAVAVEALSESSSDAIPYLIEVAGHHEEPDLRASAAWAVSAHGSAGYLAPRLMDLAETEPEAEVRRRLYEAMLSQASLPADRVLSAALKEDEPATRIAGFNAAGQVAGRMPGSKAAAVFDAEIIPELLRTANQPNSLNLRMRAVFALRRANTPAARQALKTLSHCDAPQISTAARNGLRTSNP